MKGGGGWVEVLYTMERKREKRLVRG